MRIKIEKSDIFIRNNIFFISHSNSLTKIENKCNRVSSAVKERYIDQISY
jgi:hypothetical protein